MGRSSNAKKTPLNAKKKKHSLTDGLSIRATDLAGYRVAYTRLKKERKRNRRRKWRKKRKRKEETKASEAKAKMKREKKKGMEESNGKFQPMVTSHDSKGEESRHGS